MTPGGCCLRLGLAAVVSCALAASGQSPAGRDDPAQQHIAAAAIVRPAPLAGSVPPPAPLAAKELLSPLAGSVRPPGTATPKPAAPARPSTPSFASSVSVITPAIRARMGTSWRPGCPVPLRDLRYVQVSYWGFDDAVHRGELVVNVRAVEPVVQALGSLFRARFPLVRMQLIDPRGGGDSASRAAESTGSFNCRPSTSRPHVWSQHSYGLAIDINPVQNPYVGAGGHVEPPAARGHLDRSRQAPGMIHAGDAVVRAFAAVGWGWGGDWTSVKDYQHFSATGR